MAAGSTVSPAVDSKHQADHTHSPVQTPEKKHRVERNWTSQCNARIDYHYLTAQAQWMLDQQMEAV